MDLNWLIVVLTTVVAIKGEETVPDEEDVTYIETDPLTELRSIGNIGSGFSATNSDGIILLNTRFLLDSQRPFCNYGSTGYMCDNCKEISNHIIYDWYKPCRSFDLCADVDNYCEEDYHNTVNSHLINLNPFITKLLYHTQTFRLNPSFRHPYINVGPNHYNDFYKPEYLFNGAIGVNKILPFDYEYYPRVNTIHFYLCNDGDVDIPNLVLTNNCLTANYPFCDAYHATWQYHLLHPKAYNIELSSGITFDNEFNSMQEINTRKVYNPEIRTSSSVDSIENKDNYFGFYSNEKFNFDNAVDIESGYGGENQNDVTGSSLANENNYDDYEETNNGIDQNEENDEVSESYDNFNGKLTRRRNPVIGGIDEILKNTYGTDYNEKTMLVNGINQMRGRKRKVKITIKVKKRHNNNI